MRLARIANAATAIGLTALLGAMTAQADEGVSLRARLSGFQEVLAGVGGAVFSDGSGEFKGRIHSDETAIDFTLSYDFPEGTSVAQAHLHFGQRHATGGIVVFLCANVAPPSGIPTPAACPSPSGTVSGVIEADSVIGLAGQGFPADDLDALIEALRAGVVYVNVHTAVFPAGEIRGQVGPGRPDR